MPQYCILGYGPVIDREELLLTESNHRRDQSHQRSFSRIMQHSIITDSEAEVVVDSSHQGSFLLFYSVIRSFLIITRSFVIIILDNHSITLENHSIIRDNHSLENHSITLENHSIIKIDIQYSQYGFDRSAKCDIGNGKVKSRLAVISLDPETKGNILEFINIRDNVEIIAVDFCPSNHFILLCTENRFVLLLFGFY